MIRSHPDYPSLLSAADVLQRLGVPHEIARVESTNLGQVPYPYLIHEEAGGGQLKLVKAKQDLNGQADAEESWNGVVLKAYPTDTITDPENQTALADERFRSVLHGILGTALAGLFLFSILQLFSWVHAALLITALTGALTGYLLVAKDLGVKYKAVESFCNAGNRSSCDRILMSEDAKLFGRITFSDLTLSYFSFQLLALGLLMPLMSEPGSWTGLLALLSAGAIPVVLYSLYYQAVKANAWCRLCLIVDGVLILQALLFGWLAYEGLIVVAGFGLSTLLLSGLLLAVTGSSVLLFKEKVEQRNEAQRDAMDAGRVKNSSDVFLTLLEKQREVDVAPFKQEMMIGDPQAPIRLVMAANLFCAPCKAKLKDINQLMDTFPGKVSVAIRLLKSGDEGWTSGYVLRYWIEEIHGKPEESKKTQRLLKDWYAKMNLESFMEVYPVDTTENSGVIESLQKIHARWMEEAEISRTPTIFMNKYEMPDHYTIKNLMTMMPGLLDHFMQYEEMSGIKATSQIVK